MLLLVLSHQNPLKAARGLAKCFTTLGASGLSLFAIRVTGARWTPEAVSKAQDVVLVIEKQPSGSLRSSGSV